MAAGVSPRDVFLWTMLALALWLALMGALHRVRLRGVTVVAAVLSWLVAWAVISTLPPLVD